MSLPLIGTVNSTLSGELDTIGVENQQF